MVYFRRNKKAQMKKCIIPYNPDGEFTGGICNEEEIFKRTDSRSIRNMCIDGMPESAGSVCGQGCLSCKKFFGKRGREYRGRGV